MFAEVMDHVLDVLPSFVLACCALSLLPGPNTALIVHRSMRDGPVCGISVIAGGALGLLGWAIAAGAGLTALLAANHLLFDALHVVGALVLIWLGVNAWRNARRTDSEFGATLTGRLPGGRTPGAAFRAAVLSMAANPKAAVFAFSFYPQFLPDHGPTFATAVVLALIQISVDCFYYVPLVFVAARVAPWFARGAVRRRVERFLGGVLVALGIELAWEAGSAR